MCKKVNTVLGSVSADSLGRTLMHEHMVFGYPGFSGDTTLGASREDLLRQALNAAICAKRSGIDTIVDATPNDCGRDPELLKEISERAELQIICATGYYCEALGSPSYFKFRADLGYDMAEEIYEMMMTELTVGIEKTGIKPGVIKVASSLGRITEYERAFFKSAARVQRETGTVIITHTEGGTMGPQQAELLLEEGGIKEKIAIGHMCGNRDISYHLSVLEQGVYDAFDRFGEENFFGSPSDTERITLIRQLMKKGYGEQILMSHDSVNAFWGRKVVFSGDYEPENKIVMTRIPEIINPQMLAAGMTQEQVDHMQIGNIARLFA